MFTYFGYGSNLDAVAMRAKGVVPARSRVGELRGWRLRFDVAHFFADLEGGVANIEHTGRHGDLVLGVLHDCDDAALELLDRAELYPDGYDRITVAPTARTTGGTGEAVEAIAYVGTPAFLDATCRPSQRYLNIVVRGARAAGLDEQYVAALASTPVHEPPDIGAFEVPPGDWPTFDADELVGRSELTALAGHVFDMSDARPEHRLVREWFGGHDVTETIAHRSDASDATETLDEVLSGAVDERIRQYVEAYLTMFAREYRYAGTCRAR